MNTTLNTYVCGILADPSPGVPPVTTLGGTFTVAASAPALNTYLVTFPLTEVPYLATIVVASVGFVMCRDASEALTNYTRVLTGATPTASATNLAAALASISGITATASGATVTISSANALDVWCDSRASNIIVEHVVGVSRVLATGRLLFNALPLPTETVTLGTAVFEFFDALPYIGANNGVLLTGTVTSTMDNLKVAIDSKAIATLIVANVDNTMILTAQANTPLVTNSSSIVAAPLTGYTAPTSSVSGITLSTNWRVGDVFTVTNGTSSYTRTIVGADIGTTPPASATLLASLLSVAGFPAVAVDNKVTITYGPAFGAVIDEPEITNFNDVSVTVAKTGLASVGNQLLVSGNLALYATDYKTGQLVLAGNSAGTKEFYIQSYSVLLDALVVKPVNSVAAPVGTVYTYVNLPPIINTMCLTGGGLSVAAETAEEDCRQDGLMTGTPFVTGYTPTLSFEMTGRITTPVKTLMSNAIHSKGWVGSVTIVSTASLVLVSSANQLFTYRVTVNNPSAYNIPALGQHVDFRMSGWVDKLKNAFPYSFSAISGTYFEFATPRVLTPETNILITVVTATWLRNNHVMSTFTTGQYDGFENIMASGCCASGIDLTSTGKDAVKFVFPSVIAGQVQTNPQPLLQGGVSYPFWLKTESEMSSTKFVSARSIAYIDGILYSVVDANLKVDGTHTAEVGGAVTEALDSDGAFYPSTMIYQDVKPTISMKCSLSASQMGLKVKSMSSCPTSIVLRYTAKEACTSQVQVQLILVHVPNATIKSAVDSPTTKGARYITYDATGGYYKPTNQASNNTSDMFAVQISYFTQYALV